MAGGTGEKALPAPSLSVLSPVCRGDRGGATPAPVVGAVAESGAARADSAGVVRTDWPSQKMQDRRTKRNSFCIIQSDPNRFSPASGPSAGDTGASAAAAGVSAGAAGAESPPGAGAGAEAGAGPDADAESVSEAGSEAAAG